MKEATSILLTISLLTIFACKKEINEKMKVERNCTGTYLLFEGKNYHVCNLEKVAPFPDGATVNATFTKINDCSGSAKDAIVCMMAFPNEGWIEVEAIKL